ncbi:keratin [Striga asiatica]|uniref:Keratin n=1 Tax=Striga asiatica TaxID=4170 RepID=A0A5A7RJL2_STRAF|nr:keratin [Striga asiatica]
MNFLRLTPSMRSPIFARVSTTVLILGRSRALLARQLSASLATLRAPPGEYRPSSLGSIIVLNLWPRTQSRSFRSCLGRSRSRDRLPDHAEAPHVALRGEVSRLYVVGGRVSLCPDDLREITGTYRGRDVGMASCGALTGKPKIRELRLEIVIQQHIGRLEISIYDL